MKKEGAILIFGLLILVCSLATNALEMNLTGVSPVYNDSYGSPTISFICNATAADPDYNITNITVMLYAFGDNDSSSNYITQSTSSTLTGADNETTTIIDFSNAMLTGGIDLSTWNGNINFTYSCKVCDDQGAENFSGNVSFVNPLMSFYGFVKNSSYDLADGVNVTLSEFVIGSPPTTTLITSTSTNSSGYYAFFANYSYSQGTNAMQIGATINGSDDNATEVGPTLPPLPPTAIYSFFANGTLYTQLAATLRISANYANGDDSTDGNFNYDITDLGIGVGLWNSISTNVSSPKDIIVPRDRNYSISWMRGPSGFGATAVPPISSLVDNISEYANTNYVIEINKSLTFTNVLLSGYIAVSGNSSYVNCTDMIIRLTPNSGNFVPPGSTVSGLQWNITASTIAGKDFYYDATLMGSADGINYVIEWYCNGTEEYFAAIQKVQMLNANNASFNVTATGLSGNYDESANYMSNTFNTSTKCIQLYDITTPTSPSTNINNLNLNLEVTDSSFGTLLYVTQVSNGGALNWTFLNSSTVKVRVFSQQFPPYRTTIDLTKDYCGVDSNISLKPFNMETVDQNGAKQAFSSGNLRMRFLRNSNACNVVTPGDDCVIGDTLAPDSFNPLAAMMSGKVNLMIDLNNGTGNTLYFVNVDMMSSGPPDAILSENASLDNTGSASMDQLWQFGSFAPDIYDYVLVAIPYNATLVNEDWTFTTKIPALYDENWNMIWNTTDNGTNYNEIIGNYSDYTDYSSTWFTGMTCSSIDNTFTSTSCYMNLTENKFWLKLPHFSGVGPNLGGSTATATSVGGGGASSGGLSGGLYLDVKTGTTIEFQEGDRASFTVKGKEHTILVTQVKADHVTFEIRSVPLIVIVETGKTKEVDVNGDGINDITITVNKVNMRYGQVAEISIKEIKETPAAIIIGETIKQIEGEEEKAIQEQPQTEEEKLKLKPTQTLLITLVILALLAIVVFFVINKKKKNSKYKKY